VAQAIRQTLLNFHSEPRRNERPQVKTEVLEAEHEKTEVTPIRQQAQTQQAALPRFPAPLSPAVETARPPPQQPALRMGFAQQVEPKAEAAASPEQSHLVTHHASRITSPDGQLTPSTGPVPLLNVPLRIVGVIGKLYVILESDRGLVLLDQHAAHERILFEQMLNRLEKNGQAASQRLLLPGTVELSPRDANFIREQLPVLTRLGVGLSEFGESTFLLDALPPFVKASDPRRFVLELVDELKAAGHEVNSLRLGEHTVAKTVCRHAVKANDPLAGRELENLVEDLRHCAMPYTCPHGRPTIIEMNLRELEKKFGRIQ
jgi:DNA mismatch repair protein MutL